MILRIIKFIGLLFLFASIVVVIFIIPPFILAALEIKLFSPSQDDPFWLLFLAGQTIFMSGVNFVICDKIRLRLFKDYTY